MAFYLRKGFNLGPVRLNVSKGGVGVSGGVTGARVGLSPRGAYVHGGRGGVYYRKYAAAGKRRSASGAARATERQRLPRGNSSHGMPPGESLGPQPGDKVEVFTDTGVTYPSPVHISEPVSMDVPVLPREQIPLYVGFVPGILFVVLGFAGIVGTGLLVAGLVVALGSGGLWSWIDKRNQQASQAVEQWRSLLKEAGELKPGSSLLAAARTRLQGGTGFSAMQQKWIDFQRTLDTYEHLADQLHTSPDGKELTGIRELEQALLGNITLSSHDFEGMKTAVFQERFRKLTADYALTKDEERYIRRLAQHFDFSGNQVREELDTLDILAEIRDEKEREPSEITVPVRLVRAERAYAAMPGRLLRKKVLQNKTEQGIRYQFTGYDADLEGMVYLTDRRVLVVGEGSRSYRLNKVLDVILSVEDATVQLVMDGRKSPVILTLERPALFAAKLQNVLDEQADISS